MFKSNKQQESAEPSVTESAVPRTNATLRDIKRKIIRQDRISFEMGNAWIGIANHRYEIYNMSHFGCAIIVPLNQVEELKRQGELKDKRPIPCKLYYEATETQELNLLFVREVDEKIYSLKDPLWAFEIANEPFNLQRLQSLDRSQDIINQQQQFYQKRVDLPQALKATIFEMRDWLDNLRLLINQTETNMPDDVPQNNQEFRANIIENISSYLGQVIPPMYTKIPILLKDLKPEVSENFNAFARQVLGPYVYGSPFAARAYHKPRGYAGDYEMMNQLYNNDAVGTTLFDQCMHKYLIDEPAAEAVKNRATYLVEKISNLITHSTSNNPIRIASVASGPAKEIQILLDSLKNLPPRSVEIDLIDQDEESLKHAQKQIVSKDRFIKSGYHFNFINTNIKNIINDGLGEKKYDLIYSAGLFDYFSDPVARLAAEQLYRGLTDDGLLIIGNFNVDNPTTPLMEILLDWNLIYRSQKDLENLFGNLGRKFAVEIEPLKINLFANITR